jgi:hypothetical protein
VFAVLWQAGPMGRPLPLLLTLVAACEAADPPPPPPPDCSVAWQDVLPPEEGYPPGSLIWHDGQLFFPVRQDVRAVPADGGEVKTVVRLADFPIRVFSAHGWLLMEQAGALYRAPFTGGAPTLAAAPRRPYTSLWAVDENVDADHAYEVTNPLLETGQVTRLALDEAFPLRKTVEFSRPAEPEHLIAGRDDPLSGALSDPDRSRQFHGDPGRGRDVIAAFRFPVMPESMVVSRDTLFVVPYSGDFYAIPRAGGSAAALTKDASLLGGGPDGLVLSLWAPGFAPGRPVLAPTSGGPLVPFWPKRPRGVEPHRVWPAGDGAWLVSSSEGAVGGGTVGTLRVLSADGRAGPPACEPRGEITSVAMSSDFFYLIAGHNQGAAPWHILKIRRQDLQPR